MSTKKMNPLISPYEKVKAQYWLRDRWHRGAFKTATSSRDLLEDVIDILSFLLLENASPVRVDLELDQTTRPKRTGAPIKNLIIWSGKKTDELALTVTQSLIRLDGVAYYLSHPDAAPMLFDTLVEHVEAVIAGQTLVESE